MLFNSNCPHILESTLKKYQPCQLLIPSYFSFFKLTADKYKLKNHTSKDYSACVNGLFRENAK